MVEVTRIERNCCAPIWISENQNNFSNPHSAFLSDERNSRDFESIKSLLRTESKQLIQKFFCQKRGNCLELGR